MKEIVRGEIGTDQSGPRQQVYFLENTPKSSTLFSLPSARWRERKRRREKKFREMGERQKEEGGHKFEKRKCVFEKIVNRFFLAC